jgi:molybdopterin-containing oxidoreductase family membrane subunit
LGTLLLTLDLLYGYFTLSEYLTAWYGSETTDRRLIDLLMGGAYGTLFWSMAVGTWLIPAILLVLPTRRSIAPIVVASILVNIGMWVKRYLIVTPTLQTPFIPAEAAGSSTSYFPTPVEWMVTAGALAFFLLLYTLFSKLIPIVSIWETAEGMNEVGQERMGTELVLGPEAPS